jgi:hypothetical protein
LWLLESAESSEAVATTDRPASFLWSVPRGIATDVPFGRQDCIVRTPHTDGILEPWLAITSDGRRTPRLML